MTILTLLAVILGNTLSGALVDATVDNTAIVDGTPSTFEVTTADYLFSIDPISGAIAMIIIITAVSALVGIQVLGSGLSPEAVRALMLGIAYTGIWVVLSVLAYPLIAGIQVFGATIYVGLSIVYVVGVIQRIAGGGE